MDAFHIVISLTLVAKFGIHHLVCEKSKSKILLSINMKNAKFLLSGVFLVGFWNNELREKGNATFWKIEGLFFDCGDQQQIQQLWTLGRLGRLEPHVNKEHISILRRKHDFIATCKTQLKILSRQLLSNTKDSLSIRTCWKLQESRKILPAKSV